MKPAWQVLETMAATSARQATSQLTMIRRYTVITDGGEEGLCCHVIEFV